MPKNIGFNPEMEKDQASNEDWFFGTGEPLIGISDRIGGIVGAVYAWSNPVNGVYPRVVAALNHAIDFISEFAKKWLPLGTVQRGREDWMNCASNAPNNEVEKQFNYAIDSNLLSKSFIQWLTDKKYINNGKFEIADAFTTIGSGTTRTGNSLKAPLDFIRLNGVIPKAILPDDQTMDWEAYNNPARITQTMRDLGKEFATWVTINYEKVNYVDFGKITGNLKWEIFDSYVDPVDGDFVKHLAPDYFMMNYGYRVTVNELKKNDINNNQENMQLFKAPNQGSKVFTLGADNFYHHIDLEDDEAKALLGNDYGSTIEILSEILDTQIGFELTSKKKVISIFTQLINFLKGTK